MVPKAPWSISEKRVLVPSLKASVPPLTRLVIAAVSEKVRLVPTVKPPEKVLAVPVDAPRPVTVAKVSASVVKPAVLVMVMVEPEVETLVPPEPVTVRTPVVLFKLSTKAPSFKATTGFWPPVTSIPLPPLTE